MFYSLIYTVDSITCRIASLVVKKIWENIFFSLFIGLNKLDFIELHNKRMSL